MSARGLTTIHPQERSYLRRNVATGEFQDARGALLDRRVLHRSTEVREQDRIEARRVRPASAGPLTLHEGPLHVLVQLAMFRFVEFVQDHRQNAQLVDADRIDADIVQHALQDSGELRVRLVRFAVHQCEKYGIVRGSRQEDTLPRPARDQLQQEVAAPIDGAIHLVRFEADAGQPAGNAGVVVHVLPHGRPVGIGCGNADVATFDEGQEVHRQQTAVNQDPTFDRVVGDLEHEFEPSHALVGNPERPAARAG